ncbi:MAG: hypothetical protein JXL84_25485 [Deltaproteobacteria bacterium]|nr:hypothetical protein [Deltaproteobacteria bacterium]
MPGKILILALMLLGLPLAGVILAGMPLERYLEFPPRTLYVVHAPFSWWAFWAYALLILMVIFPFLKRGLQRHPRVHKPRHPTLPFPWWGWLGLLLGAVSWTLAWSRFPWFEALQAHTFTPLWISYILTMNALTYRRTGRCPLLDRTVSYLLLFPASALFWWFFEYLNRFVQNWYYVGGTFEPREYFWYATLAFSTVLPAFTATREWILSFPWFTGKFSDFLTLAPSRPKLLAALALTISAPGLAGLGIWPDFLFSLLWMSPLLILVSLQALFGEPHVFSPLREGDWGLLVSSAIAALLCGVFWEVWNFYSFAKWRYQVPFVQRFPIFEMPILGYAGYLPFGVECAVIADMLLASRPPSVPGSCGHAGRSHPQ